jgi:hypothetical protein
MNSDVTKPEKVLRTVDENASQVLDSAAASPNSYYQLLLKKCRSRRALLPASDSNVGCQPPSAKSAQAFGFAA